MSEAVLILLLHVGAPVVEVVPWPVCLHVYRAWRYADATGQRYVRLDITTGARAYVRDVRCEDRNVQGVPSS